MQRVAIPIVDGDPARLFAWRDNAYDATSSWIFSRAARSMSRSTKSCTFRSAKRLCAERTTSSMVSRETSGYRNWRPSMTLVRWSRSSSFRRIRRWGQAAPKSPVRLVLGGSRSGRDAVHTAGRVADMGKRTASQGLPLPSEARVTGDARTGVRESVTKGITGADRREWSTCTGRRRPHDVGAGSPAAFDPSP